MITYMEHKRSSVLYRMLSAFIALTFIFSSIVPPAQAQTAVLNLPIPGTMVTPTLGYTPSIIKGLTIHPENALEFDFIVGVGDEPLEGQAFEDESKKLIKYFLAALTTPEEKMWVNLSPYEQDRIIANGFGDTRMGRDMLAQDYLLKQLTASLMYPEDELGKKFWERVYTKAQEQFGTTDIPMNTFNKIWIVPEKAVVFEKDASVFVVDSHLKVMLEEDYVALNENKGNAKFGLDSMDQRDIKEVSGISSGVVREVLIPEIEKEVNQGEIFANLRQIYNSSILAAWYKKNLKESLLGQVYVDQGKTKGVDTEDKNVNQKIYDQYVKAFKKGVYNYIKEDLDPMTQELTPRKYFSGGITDISASSVLTETLNPLQSIEYLQDDTKRVTAGLIDVGKGVSPDLTLQEIDINRPAADDDNYAIAASPISRIEKERDFYLERIRAAKREIEENKRLLLRVFAKEKETDEPSRRLFGPAREGSRSSIKKAEESLKKAKEGLAEVNEVLDHPERQIKIAGQVVDKREVGAALQYIEDILDGKGSESGEGIREVFVRKGVSGKEKKKKIVVLRGEGLSHELPGFHLSNAVNAFIDEIANQFSVVEVQSVRHERSGLAAEIPDEIPERAGFIGVQYRWRNTDDRLAGLLEKIKEYVQERKRELTVEDLGTQEYVPPVSVFQPEKTVAELAEGLNSAESEGVPSVSSSAVTEVFKKGDGNLLEGKDDSAASPMGQIMKQLPKFMRSGKILGYTFRKKLRSLLEGISHNENEQKEIVKAVGGLMQELKDLEGVYTQGEKGGELFQKNYIKKVAYQNGMLDILRRSADKESVLQNTSLLLQIISDIRGLMENSIKKEVYKVVKERPFGNGVLVSIDLAEILDKLRNPEYQGKSIEIKFNAFKTLEVNVMYEPTHQAMFGVFVVEKSVDSERSRIIPRAGYNANANPIDFLPDVIKASKFFEKRFHDFLDKITSNHDEQLKIAEAMREIIYDLLEVEGRYYFYYRKDDPYYGMKNWRSNESFRYFNRMPRIYRYRMLQLLDKSSTLDEVYEKIRIGQMLIQKMRSMIFETELSHEGGKEIPKDDVGYEAVDDVIVVINFNEWINEIQMRGQEQEWKIVINGLSPGGRDRVGDLDLGNLFEGHDYSFYFLKVDLLFSTKKQGERTSAGPERLETDKGGSSPLGGINFNTDLIDWQIKRDGKGVPLPMSLQPIEAMRIDGFVPVILNVTPVSLPMLLGLNASDLENAVPFARDSQNETDYDNRNGVMPFKEPEEVVIGS